MSTIYETQRLVFRPLELSDVDGFFEMNDNPNVNKFLRNPVTTKIEAEKYIQKIIDEYNKNGISRFAVFLKESNKLIGFSGLKYRSQEENNHINFYDLGYRFSEKHWNKGYATEAAMFWLNYGFNEMNLSEIYASAVSENIASNNLLKKLGFKMTNQYYVNDLLHTWYKIEK